MDDMNTAITPGAEDSLYMSGFVLSLDKCILLQRPYSAAGPDTWAAFACMHVMCWTPGSRIAVLANDIDTHTAASSHAHPKSLTPPLELAGRS
jgi:hypothetical protein